MWQTLQDVQLPWEGKTMDEPKNQIPLEGGPPKAPAKDTGPTPEAPAKDIRRPEVPPRDIGRRVSWEDQMTKEAEASHEAESCYEGTSPPNRQLSIEVPGPSKDQHKRHETGQVSGDTQPTQVPPKISQVSFDKSQSLEGLFCTERQLSHELSFQEESSDEEDEDAEEDMDGAVDVDYVSRLTLLPVEPDIIDNAINDMCSFCDRHFLYPVSKIA